MNGNGPDPGVVFVPEGAQSDALLGEHLHLLVAACGGQVLAVRKVTQAQGIEIYEGLMNKYN